MLATFNLTDNYLLRSFSCVLEVNKVTWSTFLDQDSWIARQHYVYYCTIKTIISLKPEHVAIHSFQVRL